MSLTKPTTYTVYPDGYDGFVNADKILWAVHVELADDERQTWAVRAHGGCYDKHGVRAHEPLLPSSRTKKWLKAHRFPLDEALAIAERVVEAMRIGGLTAREVSDWVAARTEGGERA